MNSPSFSPDGSLCNADQTRPPQMPAGKAMALKPRSIHPSIYTTATYALRRTTYDCGLYPKGTASELRLPGCCTRSCSDAQGLRPVSNFTQHLHAYFWRPCVLCVCKLGKWRYGAILALVPTLQPSPDFLELLDSQRYILARRRSSSAVPITRVSIIERSRGVDAAM